MTWFGGALGGKLVDPFYEDALAITYVRFETPYAPLESWTSGAIKVPLANVNIISVKDEITITEDTSYLYGGAWGWNGSIFDFIAWDYRYTQEAIDAGYDDSSTALSQYDGAWIAYKDATNPKCMWLHYKNNQLYQRFTTDGSALVRGEESGSHAHVAYGYTPPCVEPDELANGDEFRYYWFPQSYTLPSDINV